MDGNGPRWSSDVHQADWIAPRLSRWQGSEYPITIIVPAGFEAYARVLHPVETPEDGGRLVRWADVAAWSGLPLRPNAQFHSVALPPVAPGGPPPSHGEPREGSLYVPDAEVLAGILRDWTSTPEDCWCCVWDGFGWDTGTTVAAFIETGEPPVEIEQPIPDPVPAPVRDGPRVRLPHREYLLYQGPAAAVTAPASLAGTWGQCANLCWPADHAWCVASEIDLQWTYVGGPRGLIDAIRSNRQIEALPAAPDDPVSRVEDWVSGWAEQLTDGLLARGAASLRTPRGSVDGWLRRPFRTREGELRIEVTGDGSSRTSVRPRLRGDEQELREELSFYVTRAVLELAGM